MFENINKKLLPLFFAPQNDPTCQFLGVDAEYFMISEICPNLVRDDGIKKYLEKCQTCFFCCLVPTSSISSKKSL